MGEKLGPLNENGESGACYCEMDIAVARFSAPREILGVAATAAAATETITTAIVEYEFRVNCAICVSEALRAHLLRFGENKKKARKQKKKTRPPSEQRSRFLFDDNGTQKKRCERERFC